MEDAKIHIEDNKNLYKEELVGDITKIKNTLQLMLNTYRRFLYIYNCTDEHEDN